MNKVLDILESPRQEKEETFDLEKEKFINSKCSIWDYYGVPKSVYLSYTNEDKTKMFKDYSKNLTEKYYGDNGKIESIFCHC